MGAVMLYSSRPALHSSMPQWPTESETTRVRDCAVRTASLSVVPSISLVRMITGSTVLQRGAVIVWLLHKVQ